MKVKIEYFAKLREERGLSSEEYQTSSNNALDLYNELKEKYNFSFKAENIRVAVNEEFQNWDYQLQENDSLVFIQPVAGG